MPSCDSRASHGLPLIQTASLRPTGAFAGPLCAFPIFIARCGSTIVFNPLTRVSKCGHPKKEIVSRSGSEPVNSFTEAEPSNSPAKPYGLARQPALEGFGLDENSFDFRFLQTNLSFKTINRRFEFFDSQVHIKAQRHG